MIVVFPEKVMNKKIKDYAITTHYSYVSNPLKYT